MASYAALAAGLINLRYQSGESQNLLKSLYLILPAVLLLTATFIPFCKGWLLSKWGTIIIALIGSVLLIYSFTI